MAKSHHILICIGGKVADQLTPLATFDASSLGRREKEKMEEAKLQGGSAMNGQNIRLKYV